MSPQTRSATKSTPGRSTRNSIFGRLPPSPPKPRPISPNKSPVRAAQAHGRDFEAASNVGNAQGTPWLACRDAHGAMTTVAVSETGEGTHIRWHYPEDGRDVDQHQDADVEMTVDEERHCTPPITGGSSNVARCSLPQTPMASQPYDAGSVIRTPVKKARPLQRSPLRIGDKGVRCLYEKDGVLRRLNSGGRIVLCHPVGSCTNLSREQVIRLQEEREDRIVQIQVERLLAQKRRIEQEEKDFSDSGYEDGMGTGVSAFGRGFQREGTVETSVSTGSESSDTVSLKVPGLFRGPNGELLDHQGRQMLGREGTILIDSTHVFPKKIVREEAFRVSKENEGHSSSTKDHRTGETKESHQARFGPEGTELID